MLLTHNKYPEVSYNPLCYFFPQYNMRYFITIWPVNIIARLY